MGHDHILLTKVSDLIWEQKNNAIIKSDQTKYTQDDHAGCKQVNSSAGLS